MKIAINCSICQPKGGGITEYIVNLMHNIEYLDHDNEYILYVLQDLYEFCKEKLPARMRIKKIPYNNTMKDIIRRSLFSQSFWYKEEEKEMFDIFHSPFFYAPKFRKAKVILTVHDLRLYRYPRTYGFLRYVYLRHSVKESIQRADRIIAISQFTKDEIVDTCNVESTKIKVILEAINREAFSPQSIENYDIPNEYSFLKEGRFLFSLGHIEPRKNYERLIEAFLLLKEEERNKDLKLVIAGKPLLDAGNILEKIKKSNDIYYMNYVSRQMLLWLYHNTALFVFPSIYEGFGFPPLEAASMGSISAVSNVSSIPEVCGDAAFCFNPLNIEDICSAISAGLYDIELIKNKKQALEVQLNKFSWKKNASETIAVYSSLFNQK